VCGEGPLKKRGTGLSWYCNLATVDGSLLLLALEILSDSAKLDYRYTYANLNSMTIARIGVRAGATGVSIRCISSEL